MLRLTHFLNSCLCLTFAMALAGCESEYSIRPSLDHLTEEEQRAISETMVSTPFISPGISNPEFLSAEECGVKDTARVIGVVVQGKARAYPFSRFAKVADRVINDSVTDAEGKSFPFTVTYCDLKDCVKVFQSETETPVNSLDIGILGLLDKGLALTWNGKQFKQIETTQGLKEYPSKRTTWGEWKAEYPDSLVYRGRSLKH